MTRTDDELKRDVTAELNWDPAVPATGIGVAVQRGVVTLTGHLNTYAEKQAATKAVQRVPGVRALALELDVRLSPEHRRSDTDIAAGIESALRWNAVVPKDGIRVTVDHGWVTLSGKVDWAFQRSGAEKAIRPLMGVVGISNEIDIRSQVRAVDLQQKIEEALKRQAVREAMRIHVGVKGDTVHLAGTVHSWQERQAAQGVAWSAPGVRAVINDLLIE